MFTNEFNLLTTDVQSPRKRFTEGSEKYLAYTENNCIDTKLNFNMTSLLYYLFSFSLPERDLIPITDFSHLSAYDKEVIIRHYGKCCSSLQDCIVLKRQPS